MGIFVRPKNGGGGSQVNVDIHIHSGNLLLDPDSKLIRMVDAAPKSAAGQCAHWDSHFEDLVPTLFERIKGDDQDGALLADLILQPADQATLQAGGKTLFNKLLTAAKTHDVQWYLPTASRVAQLNRLCRTFDFDPGNLLKAA